MENSRAQAHEHRQEAHGSGVAFFGILVVLFVSAIGATLPTPLYVLYQKRFHFSEIVLTLIYGVYIAGAISALLFFGRLSDQIGRRRVVIPGLVVAALSTAVFVFARQEWALFIARVLSGLATASVLGTGTAFLVELEPGHNKRRAAIMTAVFLMAGLGVGPLLAGILSQYEPNPTVLTFYVFLGLLAIPVLIVWRTRETVSERCDHVSLLPELGVPKGERLPFVSPVSTGFCVFALQGFCGAIIPSLLVKRINEPSHALAGALVFELYFVAALTIWATRRMASQRAMLNGLAMQFPALAFLLVAFEMRSLWTLIVATAVGGISVGLGFKGSLEVANQLAPGEQRNQVMANYYLFTYVGLALPAIGVGILTQLVDPFVADLTFASVIAALAAVGLAMGVKYPPPNNK